MIEVNCFATRSNNPLVESAVKRCNCSLMAQRNHTGVCQGEFLKLNAFRQMRGPFVSLFLLLDKPF